MSIKNEHKCISAFVVSLLFIFPGSSEAYIDPNTGGLFFTSVLPFVYGILGVIVVFWKKIAIGAKKIFSKNKDNNES